MCDKANTLERALPAITEQLTAELKNLGLDAKQFTFQIAHGPVSNGHADASRVSFVERRTGRCMILVGGKRNGKRPDLMYKDNVSVTEVVGALLPLLTYFKAEGQPDELLGDFCQRKGLESLLCFDVLFRSLVGMSDVRKSSPLAGHARFINVCDRWAL
jgi:sulfite reductase beta subunit-like hemoprotein